MDMSVLSTFSFNYFVIFCIFFFIAATSNLVHSVFAGVSNIPDRSGNDEHFFFSHRIQSTVATKART
jgi:hypothetical protein